MGKKIRLADGSVIEKQGVDALVRINGEIHSNFCLVAEPGDAHLLGSLTLETFSLGVDPVNKKLIPVVASAMPAPLKERCPPRIYPGNVDLGRILLAVEKYKKSEASLEKAAALAGVSISRMMDILCDYGVEANLEKEDYVNSLKTARKFW